MLFYFYFLFVVTLFQLKTPLNIKSLKLLCSYCTRPDNCLYLTIVMEFNFLCYRAIIDFNNSSKANSNVNNNIIIKKLFIINYYKKIINYYTY